jgi:hypothetical protein
MGYTQHFWQLRDFSEEEWKEFTDFAEKLTHYKPFICGPDGTGQPVITESEVMFNGDENTGDSYETFHITKIRPGIPQGMAFSNNENAERFRGFRFCKTERKPYDASVVACLTFIANKYKNLIRIKSSGKIPDWREGFYLSRAIACPLDGSFLIPDVDG